MKRWIVAGAFVLASCGSGARNEVPPDLGGKWDVQQIAGASLGEGVDVWFELDPRTGAIRGFTGCNDFTATMTAFGSALAIGGINETQGDCPSQTAATDEARLLGVLPAVQRHIRRGRSLELMAMPSGSETLVRARLADEVGSQ